MAGHNSGRNFKVADANVETTTADFGLRRLDPGDNTLIYATEVRLFEFEARAKQKAGGEM